MKYPRFISSGANNKVIALSETEVAKLFVGDTRSDIGSEGEKMQYANTVNDLVVKFTRLDYIEELGAEMLVMEQLYAIDYRTYDVEKRQLWLEVFRSELTALYKAGFVQCSPSELSGMAFDTILLTDTGLRLIDVDISAIQSKVADTIFAKYLKTEQQELTLFANYFLNR